LSFTSPEVVHALLSHPKHEQQRAKRFSSTPKSHERWRGPLILCKVKHGLHLSAKDARSFRRLQLNLPTDEDVARMVKVLKVNPAPKSQPPTPSHVHASPPLTDRSQSTLRTNSHHSKGISTPSASPHAPSKTKRGGYKQGKVLKQSPDRGKGAPKHVVRPHGASADTADDADGFAETPEATGAIGTMLAGLSALSRSVKETFSFKGGSRIQPDRASCESVKHRRESVGTSADSYSSDVLETSEAGGEEEVDAGESQKGRSVSVKVLGAILQGLAGAREGVRQWGTSGKVLPAT
jgi:hypothetical protein